MTTIGDNSNLKSIVERAERLAADKKAIGSDERDLYAEAKSHGYDQKALRKVVREKMLDAEKKRKAEETEAIADTYRLALGMIGG